MQVLDNFQGLCGPRTRTWLPLAIYTVWWPRHMCVDNFSRVVTWKWIEPLVG